MIPVIICGGFGTKLWPISREHKPKHFLPLFNGKSLFQLNYEGLRTHFKPEEIYISTNKDQVSLAQEQVSGIPQSNFILEPQMRNQGPATGLIAAVLFNKGLADEPFMLVQVDVLREPIADFIKAMLVCDSVARREKKYITGGFKPDYPVMGVDYLVKGSRINSENEIGIFNVDRFVWRSSKEETIELIKQNNALVHANHTCMTPRNFLDMLKKYKKEWFEPLLNIANGNNIDEEFIKLTPGPLEDVTEQVHVNHESLVIELPFKWVDFGTFESLDKYFKNKGMYKPGKNIVDLNGKDNFVLLDDSNKVIALVGVDNLVVVDTGDALLVCQKSQSGQVGEALKEVKKRELALT